MSGPSPANSNSILPVGGGISGDLFRSIDWTQHPLGPTENWPASLKTMLRVLFHSNHPMFIWWGPELYQFYNDAYLPSFGVGKHPSAMGQMGAQCWPEIWPIIKPQIDLVMTGSGATWNVDQLVPIYRNGRLEDVYWTYGYSPIFNDDGSVEGALVVCTETTAQIKANAEAGEAKGHLLNEKAKLEAALHAVTEGIFIFDSNGKPVYMNEGAAKVFGSKTSADVTKPFEYYFERLDLYEMDGKFVELSEWPVAKALRGESFRDWKIQAHRTDTNDRWIWSASGELAKQSGTDVTLAIVGLRNITDQVAKEKQLQESKLEAETARDEADRANELKSAFLANMSHEIRTPLGAMLGFADLLRDPNLTENERANYIEVLTRNGDSLSVIINDILDLSKVEAGHLTLDYTETVPAKVGGDVVSLLQVKAKEKALALDYTFDEKTTPRTIVSDPNRVRQILLNIVGNAIKFTQFGSVKVHAFGKKSLNGRQRLCFEVIDSGIGIPQSQIERVFEMFVQADGTMTRRFGGTGLGLALSRSLARALGGDVSITQSKEGAGTTFLVEIEDAPEKRNAEPSVKPSLRQPAAAINEQALDGIKVLVVDDAPDNRQLIWRYLTKRGAIVESAENGLLGYRAAITGQFDIVLMDIQMPVMDGYSATQKLRDSGFTKPIIALTAHAMNEVRKKALNVGYTDHLPKPINVTDLVKAIIEYVGH